MVEVQTPPVRFAKTADGTSIAYMVWPGSSPPWLQMTTPGGIRMAIVAKVPRFRDGMLRLANGRAIAWFDWRGSGQSERRLPTSLDDLLNDIAAVTAALGEVPDVAAPNAACLQACAFAASNPDAFRSLILTNPMVTVPGSPQGMIARPGWEGDYAHYLHTLARNFWPGLFGAELEATVREWAETVPQEAQEAYRAIDGRLDVTDALRALDLPVLVYKSMFGSTAASVASLISDSILIERNFAAMGARVRSDWDEFVGSRFGERAGLPDAPARLTGREREILSQIARGKSNTEIARALTLSTRTVERHVQNILTKLGVHNRVEATRWAMDRGMG